jgi:hypothetical protein
MLTCSGAHANDIDLDLLPCPGGASSGTKTGSGETAFSAGVRQSQVKGTCGKKRTPTPAEVALWMSSASACIGAAVGVQKDVQDICRLQETKPRLNVLSAFRKVRCLPRRS